MRNKSYHWPWAAGAARLGREAEALGLLPSEWDQGGPWPPSTQPCLPTRTTLHFITRSRGQACHCRISFLRMNSQGQWAFMGLRRKALTPSLFPQDLPPAARGPPCWEAARVHECGVSTRCPHARTVVGGLSSEWPGAGKGRGVSVQCGQRLHLGRWNVMETMVGTAAQQRGRVR